MTVRIRRLLKHGLCIAVFSTMISLFASAQDDCNEPGHDHVQSSTPASMSQFEPTVNEEEAKLLNELSGLANTDQAAAIAKLKSAIHAGSSPALHFALGCYCHGCNRCNEAIGAFQEALEGMPFFHRARLNLASIYLQEDRFKEAVKELTTLIDFNAPNKGRTWKLLAFAHLSMENASAAETAYRNALVFSSDDSELRTGLIKSLLDQGELEKTRALLKNELMKDPFQAELWSLLANASLTSDQYFEAMVQIECARRLGMVDSESLLTLGDLFLDQGLFSEAVRLFKMVTALEDAPVLRLLGVVEGFIYQNKLEEAGELLALFDRNDRALTSEEQWDVNVLTARLVETRGDMTKALDLYKDLIAENPLHGEALMSAGNILRKKGELEEALIYYQRAERTGPDHKAMSLVRQAQVAVEREEYLQAVKLLKQSLDIDRQPHVERYLEQVERILN